MPKTVIVKCKCCGDQFQARTADRKRGWALFCSKSCKAKWQKRRTGQHATHQRRMHYAKEYGGTPQFHPTTGEYQGFTGGFSNEDDAQNSD